MLVNCSKISSKNVPQFTVGLSHKVDLAYAGFLPSVSNVLSELTVGLQSLNSAFSEQNMLYEYFTNLKVLVVTQTTVRNLSVRLKSSLQNQVNSIQVSAYISIVCVLILIVVMVILNKKYFMSSLRKE